MEMFKLKHILSDKYALPLITSVICLFALPSDKPLLAAPLAPIIKSKLTNPKKLSTQELASLALRSVVTISIIGDNGNLIALGSGFVVGPNLIATNEHVIKGAHRVTANFMNGRSKVVYGLANEDKNRDLVLLSTNTQGVRPLPLWDGKQIKIGDNVIAVGSPEGLGGSISTGIVSSLRLMDGTKIIQTSAPISHGSSGGPLLNEYGQVIGVTSFNIKDGQNLNFAYSSVYVKQMIANKWDTCVTWDIIHPPTALSVIPVFEKAKSWGESWADALKYYESIELFKQALTDKPSMVGVDISQTNEELKCYGIIYEEIGKDYWGLMEKIHPPWLVEDAIISNDGPTKYFMTESIFNLKVAKKSFMELYQASLDPRTHVQPEETTQLLSRLEAILGEKLSVTHQKNQKYQAAKELEESIALDPTQSWVYLKLGMIYYYDLSDKVKARSKWQKVLDLNDNEAKKLAQKWLDENP